MWLHVPREYLAFAQAEADSTSDSDSLCQSLESSATWREKSLKPASWRRALTRASWTTRLSGLTCSPSTAQLGVILWMVSLVDSHVSPIPTQANVWERMTSGTSGLPLQSFYTTLKRAGASSRTYQASLLTTGETYDPTYRPWVTRLRRESSQRRRSARLTFGNASSGWPTPDTAPEAPNSGSNRKNGPKSLGEATGLWQTPNAGQYEKRRQVRQTSRDELLLGGQAKQWATPNHHDGRRPGADLKSTQHRNLNREASLHPPMTETAGETGSPSGRVLNPRFVEMLMGWPSGLTDYESSATAWSPWLERMHSLLSQLGWELGD